MIKFPSSLGEGMAPSGSSFAVTYPGVWGSRAGGVGRRGGAGAAAGAAGVCAGAGACANAAQAKTPSRSALVRGRDIQDSLFGLECFAQSYLKNAPLRLAGAFFNGGREGRRFG